VRVATGTVSPEGALGGARRRSQSVAASLFSRRNGLRLLSLVVVGAVWEAWGRGNPFFASHPTAIIEAAIRIFGDETIPAFRTTLTALFVGMFAAIPIGLVIGLAMARIRLLDVAFTPYINAIYATPRIALIPVLVLWLGIDFNLRITIVALGAVFPIIVNSYAGAKNVDPELLDTGRAFMADPRQIVRTIVLPSATAYVFAGIRIGLGRGVTGVIVAEMTSSLTGIGRVLISHAKYLQTAELYVGIVTLGLFALFLYALMARGQRWITPWADREQMR
jgi:ABC-type nitrate/sulfonate/bicarbonate transport system permease component